MKRWLRSSHFAIGGNDNKEKNGYTIVELLVVLSVTGMMFSAVLVSFAGRQSRVEFTQAVRDYETTIQNTVSDVTKGYYTSTGFKCSSSPIGANFPVIEPINPTDPVGTGINGECIFVGKMLRPSGVSTDVDTLVGRRLATQPDGSIGDSELVTTLPVIVKPVRRTVNHAFQLRVNKVVSLTEKDGIQYPEIDYMMFIYGDGTAGFDNLVRAIGFNSSIILDDTDVNYTTLNFFDLEPRVVQVSEGAIFCLEGQNGQRAEITVGKSGDYSNVFSELDKVPESGGPCDETP